MPSRLAIFLEVVRLGSFSQAAKALDYSQSAVSQAIRALEDELGAALLERGKAGVRLTPDGAQYLPYIRAVCTAENALQAKRQELLGLGQSTIRLATFTSVSRNLLPQLMQQFKARWPGVRFELPQGEYSSIRQWIQDGTVDLGFIHAQYAQKLPLQPLYTDTMVAVLPQNHPLAARRVLRLEELAREPLILLDEGVRSVPLDAFARLGLQPRLEYKVYDDYSILSMVRQGLGVSILYRLVVAGFEHGLAIRPVQEPLERTVALAWRDWETLPVAARRFAEFTIARAPELIGGTLRTGAPVMDTD